MTHNKKLSKIQTQDKKQIKEKKTNKQIIYCQAIDKKPSRGYGNDDSKYSNDTGRGYHSSKINKMGICPLKSSFSSSSANFMREKELYLLSPRDKRFLKSSMRDDGCIVFLTLKKIKYFKENNLL